MLGGVPSLTVGFPYRWPGGVVYPRVWKPDRQGGGIPSEIQTVDEFDKARVVAEAGEVGFDGEEDEAAAA